MLFLIQAQDGSLWLEAGVSPLQAEARFMQHRGANSWARSWVELDQAMPLHDELAVTCIEYGNASAAAAEEHALVAAGSAAVAV